MRDGFIKIAAATPDLHVADCEYNAAEIVNQAKQAAAKGAKLITFPELCLTGYTCGDLFLQETLLEGALKALETVRRESEEIAAVIVVGLPLRVKGKLYNVAAVVNAGDVLAFVPKMYIPNYSEFYEQRHFVGESTQDLVFAGHDLIAENGAMLAESRMFEQGIIYADIDLQRLAHERQRMNTFEAVEGGVFSFSLAPAENDLADRTFPRTPFVPANKALRSSLTCRAG